MHLKINIHQNLPNKTNPNKSEDNFNFLKCFFNCYRKAIIFCIFCICKWKILTWIKILWAFKGRNSMFLWKEKGNPCRRGPA